MFEERCQQDKAVRPATMLTACKTHDQPAAGGMPADNDGQTGGGSRDMVDQVGKVFFQLADMIDIAAPQGRDPMTAQIRHDDGVAAVLAQKAGQCMELHAVPARPVHEHNDALGCGRVAIAPVGKPGSIASQKLRQLGQVGIVGRNGRGEVDRAVLTCLRLRPVARHQGKRNKDIGSSGSYEQAGDGSHN